MTTYIAGTNTPGCMPDPDALVEFDNPRDAWQHLVDECDRAWDDYPNDPNGACVEAHTLLSLQNWDVPGDLLTKTPGYDGNHDLGTVWFVQEDRS